VAPTTSGNLVLAYILVHTLRGNAFDEFAHEVTTVPRKHARARMPRSARIVTTEGLVGGKFSVRGLQGLLIGAGKFHFRFCAGMASGLRKNHRSWPPKKRENRFYRRERPVFGLQGW
jgi:hypothetical protein